MSELITSPGIHRYTEIYIRGYIGLNLKLKQCIFAVEDLIPPPKQKEF